MASVESMDAIEKVVVEPATAAQDRPALIKPAEACQTLTISAPTLRKLAKDGVLTQIRYSTKCARYRRDEVDKLRAQGVPHTK